MPAGGGAYQADGRHGRCAHGVALAAAAGKGRGEGTESPCTVEFPYIPNIHGNLGEGHLFYCRVCWFMSLARLGFHLVGTWTLPSAVFRPPSWFSKGPFESVSQLPKTRRSKTSPRSLSHLAAAGPGLQPQGHQAGRHRG